MTKTQAINTQDDFILANDLKNRTDKILSTVKQKLGFSPEKILWQSDYFGSGKVGAIHYTGAYQNKKAVLKIQGAKPVISEAEMIQSFESQNKSKIMRAPEVYNVIPWNDNNEFEAIVMEHIEGNKIIEEGEAATKEQIKDFFEIYEEYRRSCISKPWLSKPDKQIGTIEAVEKAWRMGIDIKKDNPYRLDSDLDLAKQAAVILEKFWQDKEMVFAHGHLSVNDLKRQGEEIVIFSNLFWKWKYPYYDAVFAYHWFIYSLANNKNFSEEMVENQKQLWKNEIYKATDNEKLVNAAFLERAIAGLVLDSYAYVDKEKRLARYMIESTRDDVRKLSAKLA